MQFLIEEALLVRMDGDDDRARREAAELEAVAAAERRVHDNLARMQRRMQ